MFQLDPSQTSNLLAQPESGMGFQLVEVTTADQRVAKGVVYNADLLLFDSEPKSRLLTEGTQPATVTGPDRIPD